MYLFILDSLGSTELLVILGAALIFFGPRKLPQLSRQLGKSLSEFRRASDDFKRTWEREVNLESFDKGIEPAAGNSISTRPPKRFGRRGKRRRWTRRVFQRRSKPLRRQLRPWIVRWSNRETKTFRRNLRRLRIRTATMNGFNPD